MIKDFDSTLMKVLQKFPGPVVGGVIDHDHFGVETAVEHAVYHLANRLDLVIDRDHDRYLDRIGHQPLAAPSLAIIAGCGAPRLMAWSRLRRRSIILATLTID